MCNFLSAIGVRDGSVRLHPLIDSHYQLLNYLEMDDLSEYTPTFVKLELTPSKNWLDPESWDFTVDEKTIPVWCDDELQARFRREMINFAKSLIIKPGKKSIIVDGVWIIGGSAQIQTVVGGRIVYLGDTAEIVTVCDSAKIDLVCDSAKIGTVRDSAKIGKTNNPN
jgi:hypothetical protein